jgi:hypothetical protein
VLTQDGVERLGVTRQLLALKREIREWAELLEELERRLRAYRHRRASTCSPRGWADA